MKNGLRIMLIISLILAGSAGFVYADDINQSRDSALSQNRIDNITNMDYKYRTETLEDVESLSELIVRVRITADSENIIVPLTPDGLHNLGFTKTKAEVIEVFKGKVATGDMIVVAEPYFFDKTDLKGTTDGGGDYCITIMGYLPSVVDQEYIFFLALNDYPKSELYGCYSPWNDSMGRYPVLTQTKGVNDLAISSPNSEFRLTDDTESTIYREIFASVHQKYVAQPSESAGSISTLEVKSSTEPTPFAPTIVVAVNGKALAFDVPPQNIDGRIVVPLRAIFEEMGASLDYDSNTRTVTATKDGTVVILVIGDTSPTVNGQVIPIEQPGVIVDGRTLAPLRFAAEAFGGSVIWDGATQTAHITK